MLHKGKVEIWNKNNTTRILQIQNFFPPPEPKHPELCPIPPQSPKTVLEAVSLFPSLLLCLNSYRPLKVTLRAFPVLCDIQREEHWFSPPFLSPAPEIWLEKSQTVAK